MMTLVPLHIIHKKGEREDITKIAFAANATEKRDLSAKALSLFPEEEKVHSLTPVAFGVHQQSGLCLQRLALFALEKKKGVSR